MMLGWRTGQASTESRSNLVRMEMSTSASCCVESCASPPRRTHKRLAEPGTHIGDLPAAAPRLVDGVLSHRARLQQTRCLLATRRTGPTASVRAPTVLYFRPYAGVAQSVEQTDS